MKDIGFGGLRLQALILKFRIILLLDIRIRYEKKSSYLYITLKYYFPNSIPVFGLNNNHFELFTCINEFK
jgi:hypothetical protein